MKRTFILLQIMAIHLAIFSQSNYNLKFEENEFSFFKTPIGYEIISKGSDYYLLEDTTLPALPYKTIHILIPENTNVENVTVNVKTKEIFQDIFVMNNPVVQPTSIPIINNSNVSNYSKGIYPDKNLKFETVIKSRGFYMAAFSVCPFTYNTQKRSLELITEMDISFNQSRKSTKESVNSSVRRYDMKDYIKSMVINPEEINTLYPQQKILSTTRTTTDNIEYLIITSEDLKESFLPLKAWKTKKGIKTEILSTNYIYSNYTGSTNQIKIKKCLQDYYENKNLKWALLGGDNTIVPVQICYVKNGSTIDNTPCDLFFACFDNTFDWNANENDIIGETDDDIDMSPEIYISRLPIRNREQTTAFINKLMKYEINPATSNYIKKMLLAGNELWNTWDGRSDVDRRNETMYNNYIAPFWDGIKYRFYDTGTDFAGDETYDLNSSNLQTQIDNGYHFFHMATHGGTTTWSMETGSSYNSANALALQNENASIILTMACNTNGFDKTADPCLSEAFIRNPKGACIAYWGSSRVGWDSNYPSSSLGPSFQYNANFYNLLFNGLPSSDGYKFAAITSTVKEQTIGSSIYYGTKRWLQFTLNAIGDPEMPIYTEDPLSFSNPIISQSGTTVTINTGGVAGCIIALTSMDFGTTYFEVKENVSNAIFTNVSCPYYVTITKHNYIPYQYPEDVYIQNFTFNHDAYVVGRNIYVGNNVKPSSTQGDVIIKNGVNVIFEAKQNVNFDSGFETELGGTFEVHQ